MPGDDVITGREFEEFRGDFREFRAEVGGALDTICKSQATAVTRLDKINGQVATHAKALALIPCLLQPSPLPAEACPPARAKAINWKHPGVIAGSTVTLPMLLYSLFELGKAAIGLLAGK